VNCALLEHSIALYVEGDLQESERRKVELHLQGCSSCRELADALMTSLAVFKELRQGTPQPSELSEVRRRVLNEVGDLQPAPGWVLAMHRLVFAGLRRKTAIAGVLLAALVSGGVWYEQTRPVIHRAGESPVQVAQFESPSPEELQALVQPLDATPKSVRHAIPIKAMSPFTPVAPATPAVDEPASQEAQVSQIPMKFLTDDPDIIIYWLPADKGD
jgi:anti-sigma-K factor RskA